MFLVPSPASILQEVLSTQPGGGHLSRLDPRSAHLCFLSQPCNIFVTMSVISNCYAVDRMRYREEYSLILDECRRRRRWR
jgi:hypothetical protein